MKVLHVNDVASVGSILVRASRGRDALYQPALRRSFAPSRAGAMAFAVARMVDVPRLAIDFRRGGFTHLHVHYGTFAHLAELGGLAYSLHVHGGEVTIHPFEGGLKHHLGQRGIRNATRVVVSTPNLLGPIRAIRADAIYIPNPVELPPMPARREVRDANAAPRVLVLSKMDPKKGWPELISVLQRVREALPGMTFAFFRHGLLAEREREEHTRALIAIGGEVLEPMPRGRFLDSLASYDFGLGQLDVGALGMSELEAMGAALPTVADARMHEDAPPVIDPRRAAAEIARLWADRAALEAIAREQRAYVEREHDPVRSLSRLEALIA